MNSRNLYVGCTLFPKASSADSDKDNCMKSKPKTSKSVVMESTRLGKREKPTSEKPPLAKKLRSDFKVGDCMNLHDGSWANVTFLLVLCKCLVIDAYCFVAREFSRLALPRGS